MRKLGNKHSIVRNIIFAILAVLIITAGVYLYFGGFTTGKSADTEEFSKYARQVSEIPLDNTSSLELSNICLAKLSLVSCVSIDAHPLYLKEHHMFQVQDLQLAVYQGHSQ